jgi:crotonobetainyl-CoA:carnitine CoA-transferase CaiB-like acyl-CoA transferase
MAQYSVTKEEPLPMPDAFQAWSVYDIFDTADCDQLFIGVVSDTQYKIFCEAFDRPHLLNNPAYETNAKRYHLRPEFLSELNELFSTYSKADLMEKCDHTGLPFAPIVKPHELHSDPHLKASKAILSLNLPTGGKIGIPGLPLTMGGGRLGVRLDLPGAGEHGPELVRELGMSESEVDHLVSSGILKINDK